MSRLEGGCLGPGLRRDDVVFYFFFTHIQQLSINIRVVFRAWEAEYGVGGVIEFGFGGVTDLAIKS